MIGYWVGAIFVILVGLGAVGFFTWLAVKGEYRVAGIIGAISSFLAAAAIVFAILWSLYCTEPGKRVQKTFNSEAKGGIERTVTVYNINGDVIETYTGKFDVSFNDSRIIFDDEDGKRHQIFVTTGTVIIDEK